MEELQPGEMPGSITYAVTLPVTMTDALADFLGRRNVEFRPRDVALRLNDLGCEPEVLHGHQAWDLLDEINGFLRKRRIHPLVPGNPEEWTYAQLHEFLELAMDHFSWEGMDERPSGAWWLDEGSSWDEVTATFGELFGKRRAGADWPPAPGHRGGPAGPAGGREPPPPPDGGGRHQR